MMMRIKAVTPGLRADTHRQAVTALQKKNSVQQFGNAFKTKSVFLSLFSLFDEQLDGCGLNKTEGSLFKNDLLIKS